MKHVLLLHPKLLFYKVPIYNKLSAFLKERGYDLSIWPTELVNENEEVAFDVISKPMSMHLYCDELRERRTEFVIVLLMRRSPGPLFYLWSLLYGRASGRKVIYYGHGLNLRRRTSRIELLASNVFLFICNRIILYSPLESRYLWKINRKKVSVAYNTLDLEGRRDLVHDNVETLRNKYKFTENKLILFSARIQPRKKLELLLEVFLEHFSDDREVGLVIVGPDMPKELESLIEAHRNIHYLGPVYDRVKMSEIFSLADLFCIPGALGLAIVEAFYWGLPIVTMDVFHGPEAYLLKNNENCLIANGREELSNTLACLVHDNARLKHLSEVAKTTFMEKASLKHMLEGFIEALEEAENSSPSVRSRS